MATFSRKSLVWQYSTGNNDRDSRQTTTLGNSGPEGVQNSVSANQRLQADIVIEPTREMDSQLREREVPVLNRMRPFSLADIEKTASLAAAETVDNAREQVDSLVATASGQLLNISLTDIMLGAWTKMLALQQYATGDKLSSEETHKFLLTEHKITSKHAPKIELFVYDSKINEVTVDIVLTLTIAKTTLLIKQGRITEIALSGCHAAGKLSCHGQKLLERKSRELELPSSIPLGEGVEIPPPLNLKAPA